MSVIKRKKERLLNKKEELLETWTDLNVLVSQYLDKLNYVVDAVLCEEDSVAFFQTYPKVSNHVDKIVNIFLQVQCEFSLLTCENILSSEVCNLRCLTKTEQLPVETGITPQREEECDRKVSESVDLSLKNVCARNEICNTTEADRCESSVEVGDAEKTCTEFAVINDRENATDEFVAPASIERCPLTESREVLTIGSNKCTPAKTRISQYDIKPNEVLEMVYSHGDNPWNFWLRYYPCSDIKFIQESASSMYYTNRLAALSVLPDVGDYVLVADGERFLRGKVLTVRGTELSDTACVMLLDVDSGRMKSFKLRYVWKIPEELTCIQAQAVNCQLEGIEGDASVWCKENLRKCHMERKFEELMLQTTLSVKFSGTVGGSSLPRYIIDADCIDVETDKIYNVSQLVNSTIIPAIMCKPFVEKCSLKSEPMLLHNSSIVASLPSDCETNNDITLEVTTYVNEISEKKVPQNCKLLTGRVTDSVNAQQVGVYANTEDDIPQDANSLNSHCIPSIQTPPPLYKIDTNLIDQNESEPDHAEVLSLSETCSDVILDVEDSVDSHADGNIELTFDVPVATKLLSTDKSEGISSVTTDIYCSRDFVLKKSCSNLINKTVSGFPTFVDSPSLFYMQMFSNESDEFRDLHEKMALFYSDNKIKFSTKEAAQNVIKSYCVAMYPEDSLWYRGEIIDWMPSTETSVCVSFVDIGDKMVIELDSVQPLAKQFAEVPVLSQKCHLYGVAPIACAMYSYVSYEWSARALSEFRNILNLDHVFTMQVKELTSYDSLGVVLFDPTSLDASINTKLVNLGEAKCVLNKKYAEWDPMKEDFCRSMQNTYDDEDACEAVMGYSPKDEERFCKFYARDGRCYKGANCKKEHVLCHPGGWISDKEEVFQEAFSQVVLPEVGETVFLQVTCVIRINLFYIIFNVDENPAEETLLTLNRYINDKNNLKNLRKLKVTPAVGQLVLAHYHQDGIWYRARVIDTDNDNNLVQVFFVDYGNTEWVNEMYVRDIEPQYLHLPFQAIESSLAFTEMNASVDDDSLETVISVFRCLTDCPQPLRAKIISKDDTLKKLELQLFDVNDHDIALMLADTGFVSITSVQMTPAAAFAVPG